MQRKETPGYLFIDKYEDTGDSHETKVYEFKPFERAAVFERKKFHDDAHGEKVEDYYEQKFNFKIEIP